MRKIKFNGLIAGLIAAAMLLPQNMIFAADNPEKYSRQEEAGLVLSGLGIVNSYSSKSLGNEIQYTNNDVADMIDKVIYGEGNVSIADKFPENLNISSRDTVTADSAVKMLVIAMGYDVWAQAAGGKTEDYFNSAKKAGILKNGTSVGAKLTEGEFFELFYNALTSDILELKSYGANAEYAVMYGKNLLNTYMHISVDEGVITENGNTALNNSGSLAAHNVRIVNNRGTFIYSDPSDCAGKYLGYNVKLFYFEGENGDEAETRVCIPKNNGVLNIKGDNIDGISIGDSVRKIRYFTENEKSKEVSFSSDAYLIYNGAYASYRREILNLINSAAPPYNLDDVTLVDYDNNGKYEVVFVNAYRNIVVSQIDKEDKMIYDAYGGDSVSLDSDDDILLQKSDGTSAVLDYIGLNDVISVYEVQKTDNQKTRIIKLVITRDAVPAQLKSRNDNKLHLVNNDTGTDIEREIASNLLGYGANLQIGIYYTFFMDKNGKIAGYTNKNYTSAETISDTYKYGINVAYVMKIGKEDGTDKFIFRMYAQNDAKNGFEAKTLTAAEKFKLNGIKIASSRTAAETEAMLTNRFVTYKLNSEGEIAAVTCAKAEPTDGCLSSVNGGKSVDLQYKLNGNMFCSGGYSMVKKTAAGFITVPAEETELGNIDRYGYSKYPELENDKTYNVEGYVFGDREFVPEFIVVKQTQEDMESVKMKYTFLVDRVTVALNENDEECMQLEGFQNKVRVVYNVEGTQLVNADKSGRTIDVHKGDLLWLSLNNLGEINCASRIYDYENDSYDDIQEGSNYNSSNRVAIGTIYDISDYYIQFIPTSRDISRENAETHNTASYRMAVYDARFEKNPAGKKGFVSDLVPYTRDTSKATRVVITSSNGEPRDMVFYLR